jgi:hypothetical protein
MTKQEIFDKTVIHLRTQGCKSAYNDYPMYKDYYGRMCAVGVHIPPSKYNKKMEHTSVSDIIENFDLQELTPHRNILEALQSVHDEYESSSVGRPI